MVFWFSGIEVGTKNQPKIDPKLELYLFVIQKRLKMPPKRPKTPPRRSKMPQDAPKTPPRCAKTPQDAPRTAQDRPEVVPGRLQDAARRPKTAPRWSQEAPETAQDAHRSERKKGPKAIRSTIPSRPSFWSVFGRILEGFRVDSGWFWG